MSLPENLRHAGFRIAIDDFGSGYATFNYCINYRYRFFSMCTVTLHRGAHNTIVTMNRDERKDRTEGVIHQETTAQGIDYLFPVDALSGGTWLGVNACGIGACLLNGYGHIHLHDNSEIISRGKIIPQILECRNLQDACQLLDQLPLHRFRNFDLLLFNDNAALQFIHENGARSVQSRTDDWVMMTSSAWNKDAVLEYRQHKFDEYMHYRHCYPDIAGSTLRDFHLLNDGDSRFSVLMNRTESHTKSVSQLILDHNAVSFRHLDKEILDELADGLYASNADSLGQIIYLTRQIQSTF